METSVTRFALIASLVNALVFHQPLYSYARENLDPASMNGVLVLITLFLVIFLFTALLILASALLSRTLARYLSMLLAVGNAVALYFIATYQVVLDRTMMGNVLNTSFREASAFLDTGLFVYVLGLGLPMCLLLARTRIRKSSRLRTATFSLGLFIAVLGWVYASAGTWLWIDRHAKKLGGMVLPFSYLVNTARYERARLNRPEEQALLPDARFADERHTVVVLVIGETARAANFSLYGYERDTNPLLSHTGAIPLAGTTACSTYTTASLRCILSHIDTGSELSHAWEPLPSYLHRHGVDVIWRSNNWGEPHMEVTSYQRARDLRAACTGPGCRFDEALLTGLADRILASPSPRTFVVLHQRGSHGPTYHAEYPERFEQFRPVCRSVELNACPPEALRNAYDNTILYTDFMLSRVIELLRGLDNTDALMMYVSDHGESLGEYGLYLHGTPWALAPDEQKEVPFIVWMNGRFQAHHGVSDEALRRRAAHSQLNVFHSIMGAFGMSSAVYDPGLDIFHR